MFNKKNSNKEKLMNMLGYRPDPSNNRYVYYDYNVLDIDTSNGGLNDADAAKLAFANVSYYKDTYDFAKNITKRDVDKQLVSEFMKFAINEMIATGTQTSIHSSTIRDLNLDGSYPNENDLEHRVRAIVQDELNKR